MNYPVTESMRALVCELHDLREVVEIRVSRGSREARHEWSLLRARIPETEALACGTVALSEADLHEMRTKIARFAEILAALSSGVAFEVAATPGGPAGRRHS
jgi:hypothetical protein